MSTALNIGNLPNGFCPATYQAMLDGFGAALSVDIPANSGFQISSTKPSDTSKIWYQIDSLGRFTRIYIFGQGSWLAAHPSVPGLTQWWFSALPNFATFDGGDSGILGPASGPMWQQAQDGNGTLIAASFLVAAGTLPSALVLALGGTGGEENHLLTVAEAGVDPDHQHAVARASGDYHQIALPTGGIPVSKPGFAIGGSGDVAPSIQADYSTFGASTLQTDVPVNAQTVVSHNNMPPYVVGYLLQRTSRLFYSVN